MTPKIASDRRNDDRRPSCDDDAPIFCCSDEVQQHLAPFMALEHLVLDVERAWAWARRLGLEGSG